MPSAVIRKLTLLEERFLEELTKDPSDVAAAYQRAHGPKAAKLKGAKQSAYECFRRPHMQERWREITAARRDDAAVNAKRLLADLEAIRNVDLRDVAEWGKDWLKLKTSAELSPAAARAIKKISIRPGQYGDSISIELHDPIEIARLIGQYLGLWGGESDDGEERQAQVRNYFMVMPREKLAEMREIYRERLKDVRKTREVTAEVIKTE